MFIILWTFTTTIASNESEQIRVLYVTGGGYHNYEAQAELLSRELTERLNLEWTTDFEAGSSNDHKLSLHNDPTWHEDYDVIIYNKCWKFGHV